MFLMINVKYIESDAKFYENVNHRWKHVIFEIDTFKILKHFKYGILGIRMNQIFWIFRVIIFLSFIMALQIQNDLNQDFRNS